MKKIMKLIGFISMAAIIGLFIACDNDSGNGNPCSGGHTPGNAATCTTAQTCTVCSATITAALGHDYSVFVSTTADCTTAGQDTYKCSRCVSTEQRARAALGHDYSVFVSTTADCTTAGLDTYKCSRCTSTEERARAALGHTGDWLITTYPTELADGEEARTCSVCSTPETRTLTKATYQTYFYGTWTNEEVVSPTYTITTTIEITANTFIYTSTQSNLNQQITNLTWEIITNPRDTYISDFPSGYKFDGDKVGSQNVRFVAIDNDGRLFFNFNVNNAGASEDIFTRVQD